jgi:two-component SAPR family response regulator
VEDSRKKSMSLVKTIDVRVRRALSCLHMSHAIACELNDYVVKQNWMRYPVWSQMYISSCLKRTEIIEVTQTIISRRCRNYI